MGLADATASVADAMSAATKDAADRPPPASADFRRLLAQLSFAGLFERAGHTPKFLLVAMSVLFCVALYCVLACSSTGAHMFVGGLIGFIWIQSGWIRHDSGHYQITRHPVLNRLLQVVSGNCLTGFGIAWWKFNHNTHHIAWWKFNHNTHHIAEYYFLGGLPKLENTPSSSKATFPRHRLLRRA
ncbi:hypothetical protein D1007_17864 [Hordeum vulgare]|nr:hypothetical protein D1007_17864 [Hordeum vulgare]